MARKPRLKSDAFDWVKDTTKAAEEESSPQPSRRKQTQPETIKTAAKKITPATRTSQLREKTTSLKKKAAKKSGEKVVAKLRPETTVPKRPTPVAPTVSEASGPARKVFAKYDKRNGRIIAMRETSSGFNVPSEVIWKDIALDEEVATLLLTDKLAGLRLIDLHTGYRITKSGSSTILTQKS